MILLKYNKLFMTQKMKVIKLIGVAGGYYFTEMLPWINDNDIKCTYFAGRNEVTFSNDEDALAFMLKFNAAPNKMSSPELVSNLLKGLRRKNENSNN